MSEQLAIQGSTPSVSHDLKVRWPIVTDEDKAAVLSALEEAELGGPFAHHAIKLQEEFAAYEGLPYCLAFNNGTSALHSALAAAGVEPGDEVITSAFSFIASGMAALQHNAIPVFVDIDPQTFNIDVAKIEEKITSRTKVLVPVHIHGLPADMDAVNALARKHGLKVIEDACQSHGATYRGQKTGAMGDIAVFSLNRTKNLQAGEGGLLVTGDKELLDRANMVRMYGEFIREGEDRAYVSHSIGWNYRTQELPAALGRSQLKRLDAYNNIAQRNGQYLTEALETVPGIEGPYVPEDCTSVYHKYRVRLDPGALGIQVDPIAFRGRVREALEAEGVDAVLWQTVPLAAHPVFTRQEGYGKGCPWTCTHYQGQVTYRAEDYPETVSLLDNSLVICSEAHPIFCQPLELMEQYAAAMEKVMRRAADLV